MIEVLIILIVVITILFVLALCKTSQRADKNARIIFSKFGDDSITKESDPCVKISDTSSKEI